MKVYNSQGLVSANADFTGSGWRIISRTIDVPTNFTVLPVFRFTAAAGNELNIQGELIEVAYPQGNQTEISYREFDFSVWLSSGLGSESRFYNQKVAYGSPYTSTATPTLTGTNQYDLNVKSKDYATTHCVTLKVYCTHWNLVTITYP